MNASNILTLDNANEGEVVVLTPEEFEILSAVPAVVTDRAAPSRSARYRHINTGEVVSALRDVGFVVNRAHFTKTRKNGSRDPMFAKHQVVMHSVDLPDHDGIRPEIVFTNAHDGSGSAKVMQGAYRFICANGLILGTTFAQESFRHSGRAAEQVIDRVMRLSRETSKMLRQVESWKRVDLSKGERYEFGRLASVLRYGDANRFNVEDLLAPRRAEDDRGDLWAVFNRVQENAMKGGFAGLASTGRRATARPLTEIAKSSAFNADLWMLAEEFAE